MTGSTRARPWKRRGCNKERCTLGQDQSLSMALKVHYVQLSGTHAMSNANDRAWHPFLEMVDHAQKISRMVEPVGWDADHM